jgi:hypothetical protein
VTGNTVPLWTPTCRPIWHLLDLPVFLVSLQQIRHVSEILILFPFLLVVSPVVFVQYIGGARLSLPCSAECRRALSVSVVSILSYRRQQPIRLSGPVHEPWSNKPSRAKTTFFLLWPSSNRRRHCCKARRSFPCTVSSSGKN